MLTPEQFLALLEFKKNADRCGDPFLAGMAKAIAERKIQEGK